jgi:deoxyribodipyrimidine photo-lyase
MSRIASGTANASGWGSADPNPGFVRIGGMKPIIVWFRQDLRLSDNPALAFASRSGRPLLCLYILDDETPGDWRPSGAARWWLHHSLASLDKSLRAHGGALILRKGRAESVLDAVLKESGAEAIAWNRCYEPFAIERDERLKAKFSKDGIAVESCNAALLFEPWELENKSAKPFRIFTPFWNALRDKTEPGKPHPVPHGLDFAKGITGDDIASWKLLPRNPDWAKTFEWTPGEVAAHRTLSSFLDEIENYATARDLPAVDGTSRLSPHLNWGEIGPRQVWHAVRNHKHARSTGAQIFLKELGWREFCAQLLFYNPHLPEKPLDARFAKFPWRRNEKDFRAWTKGQTGIPIVDAGMRQLWQTGWMHNRVRMIAASFLIKHLGIHWKHGEEWFWDTLVDAGLANNAANWQWVAGCGADAAPFFRIFNPVLQGEKFDPKGEYVRRFVPELKGVPDKYIHRPWDAPAPPAGYPAPIVDLKVGRDHALKFFKSLGKG